MLSSDMTMSTDIQFTFSFVSALDIRLTSFRDARTVRARIADQADYGSDSKSKAEFGSDPVKAYAIRRSEGPHGQWSGGHARGGRARKSTHQIARLECRTLRGTTESSTFDP
ncbi:hypothetical protein L3X38_041368 [Prunus dulcis]|uniref:Uncharacterized protein n=1 Tax=Prunus dulcis TaxID=3755 RepID=A0AAD4USJ8_PRUDU|nr:hypothetical protein L3X38_041368 [Prunus dulcis]